MLDFIIVIILIAGCDGIAIDHCQVQFVAIASNAYAHWLSEPQTSSLVLQWGKQECHAPIGDPPVL